VYSSGAFSGGDGFVSVGWKATVLIHKKKNKSRSFDFPFPFDKLRVRVRSG
jgi:hypothetical protein